MAELLQVAGVSLSFGGIQALHQVSLCVGAGEVVGLVGPNGAGKTTLFDGVSGQRRFDAGTVHFAGQRIDHLAPFRRARLGIGRTFQRLEVFPELTVRDHMLVAERAWSGSGALWKDLLNLGGIGAEEHAAAQETLELVGLGEVADVPVASLGLGLCRLVELGRALSSHPTLLLADEPSSGLDHNEADALAGVIGLVQRQRGVAVLLVEHDLRVVSACAERVVVLDSGTVIAEGTFAAVITDPQVRRAYLGADA